MVSTARDTPEGDPFPDRRPFDINGFLTRGTPNLQIYPVMFESSQVLQTLTGDTPTHSILFDVVQTLARGRRDPEASRDLDGELTFHELADVYAKIYETATRFDPNNPDTLVLMRNQGHRARVARTDIGRGTNTWIGIARGIYSDPEVGMVLHRASMLCGVVIGDALKLEPAA